MPIRIASSTRSEVLSLLSFVILLSFLESPLCPRPYGVQPVVSKPLLYASSVLASLIILWPGVVLGLILQARVHPLSALSASAIVSQIGTGLEPLAKLSSAAISDFARIKLASPMLELLRMFIN